MNTYYVYIVANNRNTTFYIGVTNNIQRRMYEHKNKLIKGFTEKYNIVKLIYYEEYQYINDALAREKQLKEWKRNWKLELIKKLNPSLDDLTSGFRLSSE